MIGSLYYLIEQIKQQRITRRDIANFRLNRYLEFNDIVIPTASSKSNDKQRNEFFARIEEHNGGNKDV